MRKMVEIEKIYNTWLDNVEDNFLLDEIKNMSDKDKEEAFSEDISFGTGGLRGIIGAGSNKMNEITIKRVTLGFINYLNKYDSSENKKVALSYDPRHKSKDFIYLVIYLLAQHNIKSIVFKDISPTPLLSYLVREKKCNGGVMLTASHNPKEYNGYKVYNNSGAQLNLDESALMIAEVDAVGFDFSKDQIDLNKIENDGLLEWIDEDLDNIYFNSIDNVIKNKDEIKDLKITYTPLHGTGYKILPKAFDFFGFNNVTPVKEQSVPDSDFTFATSMNPEDIKAYDLALKYAKENDSDLIIANDPDADRLGIMYKNKNNEYVFQTGNETGVLLIDYLIHRDNLTSGTLYKTVVTGDLGKKVAEYHGITVEETLTGFKFIGDKIKNNKNNDFIFGYEESYGYLINDCVRDKDAIQSSLLIAEMTWFYKNHGFDLGDVLDKIYDEYGYSYEITNSIVLKGIEGHTKINKVMDHYKNNDISDFSSYVVEKKLDYNKGIDDIPKSNVIKFYLKDLGWIVFRPSGTEPKLKVYFSISSSSIEKSKEIINTIYNDILLGIDNI